VLVCFCFLVWSFLVALVASSFFGFVVFVLLKKKGKKLYKFSFLYKIPQVFQVCLFFTSLKKENTGDSYIKKKIYKVFFLFFSTKQKQQNQKKKKRPATIEKTRPRSRNKPTHKNLSPIPPIFIFIRKFQGKPPFYKTASLPQTNQVRFFFCLCCFFKKKKIAEVCGNFAFFNQFYNFLYFSFWFFYLKKWRKKKFSFVFQFF
jgi:hypothetical protein